MSETRALGEWVAATGLGDLPEDVVHDTKRLILDQLGCQVGCARLPWSRAVLSAVRGLSGSGPATVVVFGDRLPADEAAFVNSVFAHGNEIDDAHIDFRTHPGSVVIPAALAASQAAEGVTGDRLLVSIAVGCEVMLRVADAAGSALKDVRFHNTSSSVGPFGAAAAVARVLGLGSAGTEHALSIAGYHSAGIRQHSVAGGSVKRLQTGIGSQAGLRAAMLARAGVTGPAEGLEGARGFLQSFSGHHNPSALVDGLGTRFLARGPCFKRFCVKYRIHSTVDSVVELMARHQIGFDRISSIRIGVCETSRVNHGLGYEPAAAADDSNATQAAQLSIRFATAVAARHGPAVLADLGPGQFNDPEVLDLAGRVDVYREPEQERESWMNWGCVTTITTTDRESFTIEMPAPVGSPRNPMTDADVEAKFHGLADPVLGPSRADAIVEAVWHLEDTRPDVELLPLTIA